VVRYLFELYLSRAGSDGADGAAERARSAAEAMAREGLPVRWLRTIFVPEDETCFYLFEAGSAEVVRAAGERAEIAFDRVLEASETEVAPGVEGRKLRGYLRLFPRPARPSVGGVTDYAANDQQRGNRR
jgi:hypothetical protein